LYRSEEKEVEVEDYGWWEEEEEGYSKKEHTCNSAVFRTVLEPEEAE
tara:strand:+ start:877 stop:1017 length:141 start_codon:yes stop_codon:yes gene_type:complete